MLFSGKSTALKLLCLKLIHIFNLYQLNYVFFSFGSIKMLSKICLLYFERVLCSPRSRIPTTIGHTQLCAQGTAAQDAQEMLSALKELPQG